MEHSTFICPNEINNVIVYGVWLYSTERNDVNETNKPEKVTLLCMWSQTAASTSSKEWKWKRAVQCKLLIMLLMMITIDIILFVTTKRTAICLNISLMCDAREDSWSILSEISQLQPFDQNNDVNVNVCARECGLRSSLSNWLFCHWNLIRRTLCTTSAHEKVQEQ